MRVLFIILLVAITFVLPNWVFGQTVDNKFNLKEFYPKSTKKILSNPTDPISDWPECSAPKDIIVQESKNGYFISWDGEEKKSSNYYYELKLVNNNRFEDVIQLTRNTYFIEHSKFLRTENPVHNIRRVCVLENNKVINSIWIQFAISGGGDGGGPCSASGGTIVGPNCAFLGSNFTISSSSSPTGCSTGNYAYQWQSSTSQNNGFQNISNSNSPSLTTSINNLNAGTYYFRRLVYCVDGDFCQSTASYLSSNTTSVYLQNSFNATISGNGLIQCGQSTTLTASGGGTYIWSHNLGSGANKNVTPSSTTTYTVTVTNSNGCTQTAIKTVTVSGLPNVSISGTSNINCGQSVTMTASGGVSYTWSHNLGNGSSKTVTPNSTTTYTVTITGSNGCTNTGQKTITITNAPNLTISGNNNICSGQSTTLTAYGGSTYTWSNNLGTGSIKTVSPTTSTTYTVTATSTGGCTASKEVSITVLPTPSAIITGNSNLCAGQSTTLTITGGGTYLWSDNLGSNSSVTVTPNSTKTYQATVTSSNGCTAIASKTITVSPIPIASITGSNSVCSGNSLVLTASGGFFYDWSNNLGSTNEVIVTPLSSTTYSVTVSSAGGCSAVANKSISVLPTPIALITGDGEICNGQSTTLSASGGNSYLWSNSNTSQSITVMPTENTVYKVTVTNSQNCTSDASFDVKIAANFNFTYTVNDPSPCNENSGSIVFDAPSGSSYSYSINGGSFQSSSTFNGLTAGQYTINVMNNIDNCVSENIVVTINPVACDIDPKKIVRYLCKFKGVDTH